MEFSFADILRNMGSKLLSSSSILCSEQDIH